MDDSWGFIIFTVSVPLIGLLISGAQIYQANRLNKELNNEIKELKRLSKIVLSGLEEASLIELSHDATGQVTGSLIKFVAAARLGLSARSAELKQDLPIHRLER